MANCNGIDPTTCFKIEAKVEGFFDKRTEGGRRYVKGRTLKWMVDSDKFTLCELIAYIGDEISWGNSQKPRIWGQYDGKNTEIVCDSQILQMFTMYEKERIIPFHVVVCDIDVEIDGNGTHLNFPCTPAQPVPSMPHCSDSQVGSCNPDENAFQTEMQPPNQSDDDDSEYEAVQYVDLHDEAIYLSDDGTRNEDGATNEDGTTNKDGILEEDINEPNLDDTEKSDPSITHDLENPTIKVGSLFSDVATFRKALRQFAIKNDFEFKPIKSDKTRFTAKCLYPKCHWRIHASLIQEPQCCMVKKISHPHTCPYLAVDSTHLTGKYHGQLVAACALDGHHWLYPVAFAVFDAEDEDNWTWFFEQLKRVVGTRPHLVIASDADKGLYKACARVFPQAEHRECMHHLMKNFKKKFHGRDFVKHMWLAAKTFDEVDCAHHLEEVKKLSANAIVWLERNHKGLWYKSKFSEMSKCDYINNNLAESFNSWIRHFKSLYIVDLLDQIRQLIMVKFDLRQKISRKFQGQIIPIVLKELNALSRSGKFVIRRSGDNLAEVTGNDCRHIVNLERQECTCREWQVTGKPCVHAMKFICSLRGSNIEHYIHEYYSVAKFRLAYAGYITPMTLKKKWIKIDPGFKVYPPNMKRPAGGPRKQRFVGCLESGRKRHQCKRCKQYGHQQRTCKEPINPSNFEPAPKRFESFFLFT